MIAMLLALVMTGEPAKVVAPARAKAVAEWIKVFREVDRQKVIMVDAAAIPDEPDTLFIVVGPGWAGLPKGERLDIAMAFWRGWSVENKANQPSPERCRITLRSPAGRNIGGSGTWGGSDIHVED